MTPPTNRPAPPSATGCLAVLGVLLLVVGLGVGIFMALRAGGDELARLSVSDVESTATFRLDAPAKLSLWTDIDFDHGDIHPDTSNSELPHVLDYVVVVSADGTKTKELRCNPFASTFSRTFGRRRPMGGANGRSYDGRLDGCELDAAPGTYAVSARRDWVSRDPRIVFRKTELVIRGK